MRNVYLLILNNPDPAAWERLDGIWGIRYKLSPTVALVRDDVRTTEGIAEAIGMDGETPVLGVVFALNNASYWGFNDGKFWEWINKVGGLP